jgi:hypothetical protein
MTKTNSLLTKLQGMELKATGKVSEAVELPTISEEQNTQVIQLPLWPEAVRGLPNAVLRSALFGAIRRGRRAYMQRQPLASVDGVTVLFTGPRLDQADLDVWEHCLHLARGQKLGARIEFTANGFLKAIGRSTGGKDLEWLKSAFSRLSSSSIEIKDGARAFFGAMLIGGARDDSTGAYVIEINPRLIKLYGHDGWSQIEWQERSSLKGHPLAQWLHGFYSTHAKAYPYKIETIHRLCGSEAKSLTDFKKVLRKSLELLTKIPNWNGHITDDGLVLVERKPTESQQRHLGKKANSKKRRVRKTTG